MDEIQEFMAAFSGFETAHGQTIIKENKEAKDSKGKEPLASSDTSTSKKDDTETKENIES